MCKNNFKIGNKVKSMYRARWSGEIVEILKGGQDRNILAKIAVTHDRNGLPMRKIKIHTLDVNWLEKI